MPLRGRNRVEPILTLDASTLAADQGHGHVVLEVGNEVTNDVATNSSAKTASPALPSLRQSLTEDMYKASLLFNDLSYAKAYAHNIEHYSKKITNKQKQFVSRLAADEADIMRKIHSLNFDLCKVIYGKTGSRNQREDATCVLGQRQDGKVIIIAFHGTTTFTLREVIRPSSDWGANWCFTKVKVNKAFPRLITNTHNQGTSTVTSPRLAFHGGYLRNYVSVHEQLLDEIRNMIGCENGLHDGSSPTDRWIICTGHSRGASMATIAAAMLKHSLLHNSHNDDVTGCGDVVSVGAIAFSSPGTAHGHVTQAWVHSLLGNPSNVIRIQVSKDFVDIYPPKLCGYQPIGIMHEETEADVLVRDRQKQFTLNLFAENENKRKKRGFLHSTNVKHYTINKDGYLMFDPDLAPTFSELRFMKA